MLYLLTNGADSVTVLATLTASILYIGIIFTKEKRNDPKRA
jgi:hypothetical protein